jgi:hypothetical protein
MKCISRVQSPKNWKKESKKPPDYYIWFSVCSQKYKKDDSKFVFHIWFIARFGWIFLSMNTTLVANQNSFKNKKQWSWLVVQGQICAKRLGRIWPGFGHHHNLPPEFSSRGCHVVCTLYTKYFWDCMISIKGFRPR